MALAGFWPVTKRSAIDTCDWKFAAPTCLAPGSSRAVWSRKGTTSLNPLLAYSEEMPIVRRYWRHVFGTPPAGRAALVIPDLRGVLVAASAGAGITVLPRYLCAGPLSADELRLLLDPPDPPVNTLYLATGAGALAQPHLARIHNMLRSRANFW